MFSSCSWWKQTYNYCLLPLRTEFSQCGTSASVPIFSSFNIMLNKGSIYFFFNLQLLRLFYNSFMAHRPCQRQLMTKFTTIHWMYGDRKNNTCIWNSQLVHERFNHKFLFWIRHKQHKLRSENSGILAILAWFFLNLLYERSVENLPVNPAYLYSQDCANKAFI